MGIEVPIKAAKNQLSALVREAELGRTSVITRNGKPVADIVPHVDMKGGVNFDAIRRWRAEHGPLVGYVAPDFDDPFPDDFWFPDD
jgi:prevent-host-death family protein